MAKPPDDRKPAGGYYYPWSRDPDPDKEIAVANMTDEQIDAATKNVARLMRRRDREREAKARGEPPPAPYERVGVVTYDEQEPGSSAGAVPAPPPSPAPAAPQPAAPAAPAAPQPVMPGPAWTPVPHPSEFRPPVPPPPPAVVPPAAPGAATPLPAARQPSPAPQPPQTQPEAPATPTAEAAPSHPPVRQAIYASLSANPNTDIGPIPGLTRLNAAAAAGDERAGRLLSDVARDSLHHLLGGIPSAQVSYHHATGLYGGDFEASLGVEATFDEADRPAALAGLAQFARNFNQQQVHVRGPHGEADEPGHIHPDGSYNTLSYRIGLKKPMKRHEIEKVAQDAGLYGMTAGEDFLEAYYVRQPDDDAGTIKRFGESVRKAQEALAGNATGIEEGTQRLWAYGHGGIPYETIQGDIRPRETEDNPTARRIAHRLAGHEVHAVPAEKKMTPEQAELHRQISNAYDNMRMNALDDPIVRKAYEELASEVKDQYDALPVKVEVLSGQGEPYKNSSEMRKDVLRNNHLYIFGTEPGAFGPPGVTYDNHPLLADTGHKDVNGVPLLYNDLLRAVHDYYAHTMTPNQFGPLGEEAAWRNHMAMTRSPLARWALTSETRGQNSWVNYGPLGEQNRRDPKNTVFGDQKVDLLPVRFALTGDPHLDAELKHAAAQKYARLWRSLMYEGEGEGEEPAPPKPTVPTPATPKAAVPKPTATPSPAKPRRATAPAPEPAFRPGQWMEEHGTSFEPEKEPDLHEFLSNRYKHEYGEPTSDISNSTGFLLSDGRGVPMGRGRHDRDEDHRGAIPSSSAMRRWGWPEDVVRANDESTRTPALRELMRRSGAVRVGVSRSVLAIEAASSLTGRQRRQLLDHIVTRRPLAVIVDIGGRSREYGPDELDQIDRHLQLPPPPVGTEQYARWRLALTYGDVSGEARDEDGKWTSGGGGGGGEEDDVGGETPEGVAPKTWSSKVTSVLSLARERATATLQGLAGRVVLADVIPVASDFARINSAHAPAALGLPIQDVANVASRAIAWAWFKLKGKVAAGYAQDDPDFNSLANRVDAVRELVKLHYEVMGLTGAPLPSRREVAKKLSSRAAEDYRRPLTYQGEEPPAPKPRPAATGKPPGHATPSRPAIHPVDLAKDIIERKKAAVGQFSPEVAAAAHSEPYPEPSQQAPQAAPGAAPAPQAGAGPSQPWQPRQGELAHHAPSGDTHRIGEPIEPGSDWVHTYHPTTGRHTGAIRRGVLSEPPPPGPPGSPPRFEPTPAEQIPFGGPTPPVAKPPGAAESPFSPGQGDVAYSPVLRRNIRLGETDSAGFVRAHEPETHEPVGSLAPHFLGELRPPKAGRVGARTGPPPSGFPPRLTDEQRSSWMRTHSPTHGHDVIVAGSGMGTAQAYHPETGHYLGPVTEESLWGPGAGWGGTGARGSVGGAPPPVPPAWTPAVGETAFSTTIGRNVDLREVTGGGSDYFAAHDTGTGRFLRLVNRSTLEPERTDASQEVPPGARPTGGHRPIGSWGTSGSVRLEQGEASGVPVYRWTSEEGFTGKTEHGDWTRDEDEAHEQGRQIAAQKHREATAGDPVIPHVPTETGPDGMPVYGDSKAASRADYTAKGQAAAKKVLDRDVTAQELTNWAGVLDNATHVRIDGNASGTSVLVSWGHDALDSRSSRWFSRDDDGNLYAYNAILAFDDDHQGSGAGSQVLARQIESLKKAGFKYIKTNAAGGRGSFSGYIGSKVWPKFGYDIHLDDLEAEGHDGRLVVARIRREFPDAETLLDMYALPGGADFWDANHVGIDEAKLYLDDESRSQKQYNAYRKERHGKGRPF